MPVEEKPVGALAQLRVFIGTDGNLYAFENQTSHTFLVGTKESADMMLAQDYCAGLEGANPYMVDHAAFADIAGSAPPGPAGPQGPPGIAGQSGSPGATGPQGPGGTAATIAIGTTVTGDPGTPAQVSNVGTVNSAMLQFTIPRGDPGFQGPQGTQGPPGVGAQGPPGPQGPQGPTGADSTVPGPAGPTGPQGLKGDTGNTGATGSQGPQGSQGIQGNPGATGPTGPQGTQGIPGNTGPQGPAGPAAVSADANNRAALGSDNLIYVAGSPPGAVTMYAGSSAPTGWLFCDGSARSRTSFAALFTAIGTSFGAGDGSTTFNLPDLRSRVPVGVGQGTGLTNRVLAATGGEENHQLTVAELASHGHTVQGYSNTAAGTGAANTPTINLSGSALSCTAAGSNTPHNTMQPFLALNYIIKT